MTEKIGAIKKIACLTLEQQAFYDRLNEKQRKYCDYRAMGYGKRDAYVKAGYKASHTAPQAAWVMERTYPMITDIINTQIKVRQAKEIYKSDSALSKQNDATLMQNNAQTILDIVENASPQVAEQIKFYRDIADGKIKSTKHTEFKDAAGIKTYKDEEVDDVKSRLAARKELDAILGINKPIELGNVEVGDIQINIVDTSKKDLDASEKGNNSITDSIDIDDFSVDGESKQQVKPSDGETQEQFFKRTGGVWKQ